jgi:hypothetical protein
MNSNQSTFVTIGASEERQFTMVQSTQSTDTFTQGKATLTIQGQYIAGSVGDGEVVVHVDPVALDKKLAIREINAQLDGIQNHVRTSAVAAKQR